MAGASTFTLGTVAVLAVSVWLHRQGEISVGTVLALFRFSQMLHATRSRRSPSRCARARRRWPAWPAPDGCWRRASAIDDSARGACRPARWPCRWSRCRSPTSRAPRCSTSVDLELPAGATVGLVGRTGSGKTSIGRLLVRFWDADRRGSCGWAVSTCATSPLAELRRRVGRRHPGGGAVPGVACATTSRCSPRTRPATSSSPPCSATSDLATGPRRCRVASTPCWTATPGCRPARPSCSRSPGCCSPTRAGRARRGVQPSRPRHRAAGHRGHRSPARQGRTVVVIAHRLATLDHVDEILRGRPRPGVEHGGRARPRCRSNNSLRALCCRRRWRRRRPVVTARVHDRSRRRVVAWRLLRQRSAACSALRLGRLGDLLRHASAGRAGAQARARPGRARRRIIRVVAARRAGRDRGRPMAAAAGSSPCSGTARGCSWHTVPRVNMMRSLATDPGPSTGRLPARRARRSAASATTPRTWRWCSTCGST